MRTWTKCALAIGALALAAADVHAQSAAPVAPRYRFGLMVGLNLADMTETEDADMRMGFLVGGSLMIPVGTGAFAFQPEVLYSQKGVKGTTVDEGSGQEVDITLKHDYVEIPLLLRLSVVPSGGAGVRPFLLVGPSVGISAKCEIEGESGGTSVGIDCDNIFEVATMDLGGLLGGGIEFPFGTRALSVGARYTFGFSEVFEDTDTKNRVIGIVAGLTF